MTELRLGLRLALAGGWTRALLVVIGNAVGVVVLLLATAVPTTLPQDLSPDDRRLAASLVLFLVLPVASLLASTSRLSAAVRERRLAALRLLGVTARRTRVIAACEASLLALAGQSQVRWRTCSSPVPSCRHSTVSGGPGSTDDRSRPPPPDGLSP